MSCRCDSQTRFYAGEKPSTPQASPVLPQQTRNGCSVSNAENRTVKKIERVATRLLSVHRTAISRKNAVQKVRGKRQHSSVRAGNIVQVSARKPADE